MQKVGNCGVKWIREEYTWEFSKDNYFLGLGGVPETKWFSVSPVSVPMREYNVVKRFDAEF